MDWFEGFALVFCVANPGPRVVEACLDRGGQSSSRMRLDGSRKPKQEGWVETNQCVPKEIHSWSDTRRLKVRTRHVSSLLSAVTDNNGLERRCGPRVATRGKGDHHRRATIQELPDPSSRNPEILVSRPVQRGGEVCRGCGWVPMQSQPQPPRCGAVLPIGNAQLCQYL